MLVLTRKENEAIRIGEDIVIKVVAVDKNGVRLGIEAPEKMTILREELVQAVSEENKKAAVGADSALLADLKIQLERP
ncbi:MAG: carbon storage regulator CsrA [Epsilonproteobacteria bacterium]|nr:carbon storage regulator CsrA [Campylobacterota bacterium]